MTSARTLDELLDVQAVVEACSRYAAAVDRTARELSDEAFAEYAATMTDDCVVDYGPLGRFESRAEWIAFARGLAARSGLCHHMYANFFVEIHGDDARARFHAQALHYWADQPADRQLLIGAARFDNALRRTPEGWLLTRVQPNVQFLWDPGAAAARMFPPAPDRPA
ncbi:MAG TPA: nuclear transport factor 2 family protein [Acidimicrobiia bacterium]